MKRESQAQVTFKIFPNDKKETLRLHRVSGLTWPAFVKYANRLVKEDLNRKVASELNEINRKEN